MQVKLRRNVFGAIYHSIYANSPGLSGSLPDKEPISSSPVRVVVLRFLRVAYHVHNDRFQIAENSKMDAAILNLAEQPGRLLVELLYLIIFFHDLFQVEIIKH